MSKKKFLLRAAIDSDADRLAAFAAQVFPLGGRPSVDPAHLASYIATELTPERFLGMIADQNLHLTIAWSGEEVAGFSLLARDSPHSQLPAQLASEVRKFYVAPQYHGLGLAGTLMESLFLQIPRASESLWLSVFSENPRAIAFYQKWGFRIAGKQHFYVGEDCQQDFLMCRNLKT